MDDEVRTDLHAKLSDAFERQMRIDQQIQAHADNIREIRRNLGNPYFFHPRPPSDPESRTKFTGYASHAPGLQLMRARQEVQREITALLNRLGASDE
jgi:hypothetical protein